MRRNIKGRQSSITRAEQLLEAERDLLKLKKEIQRKANIAHKRLKRLEKNTQLRIIGAISKMMKNYFCWSLKSGPEEKFTRSSF